MSVRPAKLEDVPALVTLGAQLHQLSSYARYRFDADKVSALLQMLITGGGCVFLAERDGRVVGGIAGAVTEFWFGPDVHGFDYSVFVEQESRQGVLSSKLVLCLESWCAQRGAGEMRIGITTGIDIDGTSRFYEWLGYTRNGALFTKELGRGH